MSAEETHSLADQAAAWVPPWARQPSPAETEPPNSEDVAGERSDPVASVSDEPVATESTPDSAVVEEEPFTAGDVFPDGRSGDPVEAQRPDEAAATSTVGSAIESLNLDESDMSGAEGFVEATAVEGSEGGSLDRDESGMSGEELPIEAAAVEGAEIEAERSEIETDPSEVEAERAEIGAEHAEVGAGHAEIGAERSEVEAERAEVETVLPQVETVLPEVETVLPEVETVLPQVETVLPQVEAERAEVETVLSEVEAGRPGVEAERAEVETIFSEVEAGRPEVETALSEVEAERPEVEAERPEVEAERPEVEPPTGAADQFSSLSANADESDMSGAAVAIGTVDAIGLLEESPVAADEIGDTAATEQVGEQTELLIEEPPKAEISDEELRGAVEAILLIVDEPVTEIILAQVLDQPVDRIAGVLDACSREYAEMGRGFELRRIAGGWRLYTRSEYAAYVEKFVLDGQQVRLTQAALETLAVVAYKQPVTRSRISAIRGVNCDGVVRTLVTRGLIEECGSEPESGAFLYRTTTLFLEKLGLDSVEQLPPLAPFLPDDVDEIADAQR
jgi:segregation and condensation protein B